MEFIRWTFAERFGWTLDQVDRMTMQDLEDYFQIQDAKAKAKQLRAGK